MAQRNTNTSCTQLEFSFLDHAEMMVTDTWVNTPRTLGVSQPQSTTHFRNEPSEKSASLLPQQPLPDPTTFSIKTHVARRGETHTHIQTTSSRKSLWTDREDPHSPTTCNPLDSERAHTPGALCTRSYEATPRDWLAPPRSGCTNGRRHAHTSTPLIARWKVVINPDGEWLS